jgi:hypothetical protein
MTDAQLPPWDNDPLERWEPSSAQRARAYELWTLRAEGSADFPAAAKLGCDSARQLGSSEESYDYLPGGRMLLLERS